MSVGNGFVGSSEGNKVGREERVGLRWSESFYKYMNLSKESFKFFMYNREADSCLPEMSRFSVQRPTVDD